MARCLWPLLLITQVAALGEAGGAPAAISTTTGSGSGVGEENAATGPPFITPTLPFLVTRTRLCFKVTWSSLVL